MYAFLSRKCASFTDVHYASFIYNPYSIVKEVDDHEDRRCLAPTTRGTPHRRFSRLANAQLVLNRSQPPSIPMNLCHPELGRVGGRGEGPRRLRRRKSRAGHLPARRFPCPVTRVSPRARACGREGRGAPQNCGDESLVPKHLPDSISLPASGLFPGGAERDRTDDLLSANQALSQLSYSPGKGAAGSSMSG
jgi:hypothetical protein